MNLSEAADGPIPTVYWMPHCSSCMAVKQFLDRRGVAYRSVNVAREPDAMAELEALGVRSVPVVVKGGRFVFAQYLPDVAAFLALNDPEPQRLTVPALGERLVALLSAARVALAQTPPGSLSDALPGRQRTYFVLSHHIFQLADAARRGWATGALHDADSLAEPPAGFDTFEQLMAFAGGTLTDVEVWAAALDSDAGRRNIRTDYGDRPADEVLHRVVSHAAQHARQLCARAQALGAPIPPLDETLLDGLTLAGAEFDETEGSARA